MRSAKIYLVLMGHKEELASEVFERNVPLDLQQRRLALAVVQTTSGAEPAVGQLCCIAAI